MSSVSADQLYQLLPANYRLRDAEHGKPLRALVEALAGQAEVVEADIARLYENWFVETSAEWVVPYLGDLLGVRGMLAPKRAGWSQRALVANILRYRRRKGTVPVLEQIVHDVTGWAARAVEFFNAVAVTQHLDHLRPGLGVTANLKKLRDPVLVASAFDPLTYTPDVRLMSGARQAPQLEGERPASRPGLQLAGVGQPRPNLPNLGLFIWRLLPYRIEKATAYSHDGQRFSFNPLGFDIPLFHDPGPRGDFTNIAQEHELPVRLRTEALAEELEARKDAEKSGYEPAPVFFNPPQKSVFEIFGPAHDEIKLKAYSKWAERISKGLPGDALGDWASAENEVLEKDKNPRRLRPDQLRVAPISDQDWAAPNDYNGDQVWVDPERGRIILPLSWKGEIDYAKDDVFHYNDPNIRVSYSYAFSDSLGGGSYEQSEMEPANTTSPGNQASAKPINEPSAQDLYPLHTALETWYKGSPRAPYIEISGNATYVMPVGGGQAAARTESIHLDGFKLLIRGSVRCRPVLLGNLEISGGDPTSELTLSGLLIAGCIHISDTLGKLTLTDCTLAPGLTVTSKETPSDWRATVRYSPESPSITAKKPDASLQVRIERCIVGPLQMPATIGGLTVTDSIIDAPEPIPIGNVPNEPASALRYPGFSTGPVRVLPSIMQGQLPAIGGEGEEQGPAALFNRVTVFGSVHVCQMQAEDVLFTSPVTVERTATGVLRHCFVPLSSQTPRKEKCQPESGSELFPAFTARRYGEPGYAQLRLACPAAIRTGGADGAEIGVFHSLYQPQREAALLAQVEEYLRLGFEAGVIYVT
jgi:hypothetical protein